MTVTHPSVETKEIFVSGWVLVERNPPYICILWDFSIFIDVEVIIGDCTGYRMLPEIEVP